MKGQQGLVRPRGRDLEVRGRRGRGAAGFSAALALAVGLLAPVSAHATDNDRAPRPGVQTSADTVLTRDDTQAPPPPVVPAVPEGLPVEVDPLASYQGQGICDPAAKKGTQAFADLITATYGSLAKWVWIPRDCSIGRRSEHKEGRALDWMINRRVPVERAAAEVFIDWLLAEDAHGNKFAMARRLGVMYIGWDDRIWESYRQGWSELNGCYSTPEPGFDNSCHRNHIHISLSWDGAAGTTSFWGGSPTPLPFCSAGSTSTIAQSFGSGLDFVPVTPERVVDTRVGLGTTLGTPCRITQSSGGGPGAPVSVRVEDLPDVAGRDVRAVAVRVAAFGSNSPATLRSRTFGAASLAAIRVNARTETVTVVPVAVDGTIAFTTDSGATNLQVDVLGYFVAPQDGLRVGGRWFQENNRVIYDSADDTRLPPGEQRVIRVSADDTVPSGAVVSVTITGAEKAGSLIVRRPGDARSVATPSIAYRARDAVTQSVLASLDDQGQLVLVNRGKSPVDVRVSVQAAAVPGVDAGALLTPVAPVEINGERTALRRVLRQARGSSAVMIHIDAQAPRRGATVRFWSGDGSAGTTVQVGRQSRQSTLIVVPLDPTNVIEREIVGGQVNVTARIVGYLR